MSLPSDEEQELDDTLPGPSFSPGMMDIEGKIVSLLASLQIDKNRQGPVTDEDDDMLKEVQEKIQMLIRMESDHDRKKWFKKAYLASNRIREELYNLRRVLPKTLPPHSYFDRIQPVLQDIVSKSFEEEYRKVAIVLGLVDSLAELLIMEVLVHGTTPRFPEHKSIRKLIANALTNLTFGHGPSKKRLCSYPDFILTVVKLFREAKNLVQVYAGLIRNLSWMADSEMVACLNPCVSALAAAAVDARKASDEACVRAILSALWNLASHSTESKKAICDQPGCLQMLVSVLSTGTNPTVDIESASGILKYVSQYLANHSDHMDLRPTLVRALIMHLSSSSFTALSNVLGALGNLIAKDPHVQNEIRSDRSAMHQLTSLRDSNREDMSNLVKTVLNHLQQPAGFRKPYSNMSASVGVPSYGPPRERILNHRAVMASPGNPSPMAPQFASPATFVESQRCSSLPRHFARGGYAAPLGQVHHSPQFRPQPAFQPPQQMFAPVSEPEQQFGEDENLEVDDELDAASYAVDKCNASRRSLESELPSGWNSAPESVNTTANMSPVSAEELPDSPTHYAMERYKHEIEALQAQGLISTNHLNNIPMSFNGSDLSKNGGSDAATAVIEDYPTPTFPTSFGKMTAQIENDYAVLDTTSNDLLRMSIEASLPPATPRSSKRQKSPMDGAQLLAETMQSAMPQKTRSAQRGATAQSEKLLQDCIQSSMPSPSFSSTLPKNVKGGRSQLVTSTDRHENLGHPFAEVTSSVLFSNEEGSLRDANNLLHQDLRSESSDDDFENDLDGADVDTTLPMDCFDEEEMTIDCSTLSMGESRNSRSGILKPSRLPKPTYRPGVSPRVRPVIKPKPQTQAVISPYNYQKPRETKTKSPEAKPVVHSKTNTMLVTTV